MTDRLQHWENVYETKSTDQVSWYAPHLATSLDWILEAASGSSASILDVGGGASTLVDDLLAHGFGSLTVLDISSRAIAHAQQRLGPTAVQIRWIAGDITGVELPPAAYDLWHDRAVFHFLTAPEDRLAYRRQLLRALKPAGKLILATFSTNGPLRCSGLPVSRYDAESIEQEFAPELRLVKSSTLLHTTPSGAAQEFLYCQMERS